MKLLLTSTGFANKNIANCFLQMIDKSVSQIKVVFVPAAARDVKELEYVDESQKELLDLGILKNNIRSLYLDKHVSFEEVKNFDVIYVCGGNTFYLLKKVRETGFDNVIIEFVKTGKLYFGVSAGSILVCPTIAIASPFDENDVHLIDLTGLHLLDAVVSPHYCEEEKPIIDAFKKKSYYEVILLTDNQALSIIDKEMRVVE